MEKKEKTSDNRILLIEDNLDYSEMTSAMLKMSGYEVRTAPDGITGLETAKTFLPGVIICDIGLPGMNGYEVAKSIRKDESLKGVFLIALTGYAGSRDIEAAIGAGFDRHVTKPANIAVLKQLLREKKQQ